MRTGLVLPGEAALAQARSVAAELPVTVDVEELITIRAALAGSVSRGRVSAGGSCRLLPAAGGWVAVNLARPSDVEAVEAIVEAPVVGVPWAAVEAFVAGAPAADAAERFQLFGVPAAVLDDPMVSGDRAVVVHELGEPRPPQDPGLVVDLSTMWAGPLCARLLGLAGLSVVKVESRSRPDGARGGDPRFFAWLHEGHECRTLELADPAERDELVALIGRADVVVDSSRPRALAQLGVDASALVARQPGLTWISITGYGRSGEAATKVAFGDDAAVAGGLVARDDAGDPIFVGDAVADPLSGLFAAAAGLRAVSAGGGQLVEVSMASVARAVAGTL